jgi:hypothetical protein
VADGLVLAEALWLADGLPLAEALRLADGLPLAEALRLAEVLAVWLELAVVAADEPAEETEAVRSFEEPQAGRTASVAASSAAPSAARRRRLRRGCRCASMRGPPAALRLSVPQRVPVGRTGRQDIGRPRRKLAARTALATGPTGGIDRAANLVIVPGVSVGP